MQVAHKYNRYTLCIIVLLCKGLNITCQVIVCLCEAAFDQMNIKNDFAQVLNVTKSKQNSERPHRELTALGLTETSQVLHDSVSET